MSAFLEAALRYAANGRPVFPVKLDKSPLTPHGFKDASTDPATMLAWWARWPDAGIATPTGPDWFVLDVDDLQALAALEGQHGQLPPTLEVLTPRPGRHIYFRGKVTNGRGSLPAGLDVRGEGGYVVLPPSTHSVSGRYEWATSPDAIMAEAPRWLLARLAESRNGSVPSIGPEIPQGTRNQTLASLAGTMRRRGMDEPAIGAALIVTNRERCKPPLPEEEVRRVAASMSRYEPASSVGADSGDSSPSLASDPNARAGTGLLIDMRAAIQAAGEDIDFPLRPLAARGFLTILAGRHSSRKTWLMLLGGHAVHCGETAIAGLDCSQTTVLYVDGENGPRLMGKRFRDARIPADGLLVADGTQLQLPKQTDQLAGLIRETGAGLVVLDSLRRLAPGVREDKSDDMAPVIAAVANLARELDVAIVLIHHRSSKQGAATVRGSSTIEDQADLVFTLDRVQGDSDRLRRRLRAEKYRIDVEPEDLWFRLEAVSVEDADKFTLASAEPYGGEDDSNRESRVVQTAAGIRKLAARAEKDGWAPGRLAAAVGRTQDDWAFRRAIGTLVESGEWVAEGKTRARRYRPAYSGDPGASLGESADRPNEDDHATPDSGHV